MHLTKKVGATMAALLLPAAVALAATAPSGTFTGTLHSKNGWGDGRPDTFKLTATFDKGTLTALKGDGNYIPYNKQMSNATAGCGDANLFDSSDPTGGDVITSKPAKKPYTFSFVIQGKYHDVIRLKGLWVSATAAKTKFRYYQGHLPYYNKTTGKSTATGHCDSGWLSVKLTKAGS